MTDWTTAVGWVLTAAGLAYGAVATAAVYRWTHRPTPPIPAAHQPAVTLLKPLAGAEPGLLENLESFLDQEYEGTIQMVLGVAKPDDPALPLAEAFRARHPEREVALSVRERHLGANPKINNVAGMLPYARHDVLVLSDADVRVSPEYLGHVTAILSQPGVGAVTCLYRGRPADASPYSAVLAAYINGWFLPSVLVSLTGRRHAYGLGATLAFRRQTLDAIGGLAAIADYLADDFHLARRIEQTGLIVRLAPRPVTTMTTEASLLDLLDHVRRWSCTSRTARPWGYTFSFLSYPIVLAAIGLLLTRDRAMGLVGLGAAVALRLAMWSMVASELTPYRSFTRVLVVLATELTAFVGWISGFWPRSIRWREGRWDIDQRGQMGSRRPGQRRTL
jgi:ceramide glucosyltransferase